MQIFRRFSSQHGDFIHDMCFDFYGTRLATCSSDRKIKIWEEVVTASGKTEWQLQHEINAHQASVWKLAWAHPEFGQILASCSFDRTVSIWEDQEISNTGSGTPKSLSHNESSLTAPNSGNNTNSNGPPSNSSAVGSSIGNIGMNRETWKNQAQFLEARESVHDVKFSPRHLGLRLATASEDGCVRMYEAVDVMNISHWTCQEEFLADKDGVTCISWNQSRFDPPMIVVGGNSNVVRVWSYSNRYPHWQILTELIGHTDAIHDVCWAPNLGRSYHFIATASKDRSVRIWKLNLQELNDGSAIRVNCKVEQVAMMPHLDSEVWRVEWNISGTMLASSGDDGTVRMWQRDVNNEWVCVNTICGSLAP